MKPLYREAGESILGHYNALLDKQNAGQAMTAPFQHLLDAAEERSSRRGWPATWTRWSRAGTS